MMMFKGFSLTTLFHVSYITNQLVTTLPERLIAPRPTAEVRTCANDVNGGRFIFAQRWLYNPAYLKKKGRSKFDIDDIEDNFGPMRSFTCHGICPDAYEISDLFWCSRSPNSIQDILSHENFVTDLHPISGQKLIKELFSLWKASNGKHVAFWGREWRKHGTCMFKILGDCHKKEKINVSVYDYFRVALDLMNEIDTYSMLEKSGILPSRTKHYHRDELVNALKGQGYEAELQCNYNGILTDILYNFQIDGSFEQKQFHNIPARSIGNCSPMIRYIPKGPSIYH